LSSVSAEAGDLTSGEVTDIVEAPARPLGPKRRRNQGATLLMARRQGPRSRATCLSFVGVGVRSACA
jgi:hypothetical protein